MNNVTKEHVYHPINAYNLVKRVVKYLPKISNNENVQDILSNSHGFMLQLANGIYNIEEYYDTTVTDILHGIIRNPETTKIYKSVKGLDVDDILYVQDIANLHWNYDKQISWLEVAWRLFNSRDATKHGKDKNRMRYGRIIYKP